MASHYRWHTIQSHTQKSPITYQEYILPISRLMIVSREAKKQQQYATDELFTHSTAQKFVDAVTMP